jgi:hypothetical protein
MPEWIAPTIIGIIVSVVGYLLAAKDSAQEKQITELWNKHNEDADRLNGLTSRVDREYYVKHELDARFDKLEQDLKDVFRELGDKFDCFAERLLERK